MESQGSTNHFPFLDLPPELRNRVYTFAFEDCLPKKLDLVPYKSFLPDAAITVACQQIRVESLSIFREAQSGFWKSHSWMIHFDSSILNGFRPDDLLQGNTIPKSALIRHLLLCFTGTREKDGATVDITFEASFNDSGQLQWTVKTNAVDSPGFTPPFDFDYVAALFARYMDTMNLKVSQQVVEGTKSLEVSRCVDTFLIFFNDGIYRSCGQSLVWIMCRGLRLRESREWG